MTREEIQAIINTLEKVEVRGYENLNYLLGVIQLLKQKLEREKDNG